ncbi:Mbeg1-like protein [Atopobium deltae]|nr:Mbeg1-like protein [Atopobium deltae]
MNITTEKTAPLDDAPAGEKTDGPAAAPATQAAATPAAATTTIAPATNIMGYLDWLGDVSFAGMPFNEIDALIFAQLSYLDLRGYVPQGHPSTGDSLAQVAQRFFERHTKAEIYEANGLTSHLTPFLLQKAAQTSRFKDVRVGFYRQKHNRHKREQFGAVSFFCDDNQTCYLAFRGTDANLFGWQEDLNMSFETIPAQKDALSYLSFVAARTKMSLQLGGHSKGGNLAAYCAASVDKQLQKRIARVWCFDSPGFLDEVLPHDTLQRIAQKTRLFAPPFCFVSSLMHHAVPIRYIQVQDGTPVNAQHDALSWSVLGSRFVRAKQPIAGVLELGASMTRIMCERSMTERRQFSKLLFDCLQASGCTTLNELAGANGMQLRKIFEAIAQLEGPEKALLHEFVRSFIGQFRQHALTPLQQAVAHAVQNIGLPSADYKSLLHNGLPPTIDEMHEYAARQQRAQAAEIPAKLAAAAIPRGVAEKIFGSASAPSSTSSSSSPTGALADASDVSEDSAGSNAGSMSYFEAPSNSLPEDGSNSSSSKSNS